MRALPLLLWLVSTLAGAQSYPAKPVRMILPFAAGGSTDFTARALAQRLTEQWGHPVVTENRTGVDDYVVPFWTGVLSPAATPRETVQFVNSEIHKAMQSPDLKKRLGDSGVEAFLSTPVRFGEFIKTETARYGKVVRDAGIRAE